MGTVINIQINLYSCGLLIYGRPSICSVANQKSSSRRYSFQTPVWYEAERLWIDESSFQFYLIEKFKSGGMCSQMPDFPLVESKASAVP
jgi:hypothetical protein